MSPSICYLSYSSAAPDDSVLRAILDFPPPNDLPGTPEHGIAMWPAPRKVLAMMVPAPYPAHELADDLAQRAAWPDWRNACKAWRSHVILTILGGGDEFASARDRALALLRAASVVALQTECDAVAWSGSLLFHRAQDFAQAVARGGAPADLLVRCRWANASGPQRLGIEARTFGLAAFGLPEFHHPATGEAPAVIYDRLMNLCSYVLATGVIIQDGDTIGVDERAGMQVRHDRDADGKLSLVLLPAER